MPRRSRRLQVDSGINFPRSSRSSRFRRDSFRRVRSGEDALAVARTLSDFNRTFSQVASGFLSRRAKEKEAEGREAMLEALQESENAVEAINAGEIPPGASDHFKMGAQNEAGKVAADQFYQEFLAENQDLLDSGTDLSEFDQAAQKKFREFLDERIPNDARTEAFDMGFRSRAQALMTREKTKFARSLPGRVEQNALQSIHQNIFDQAYMNFSNGVPLEDMARDFTEQLDEYMDVYGRPGAADRNRVVAEAIMRAAEATGTEKVLDLLHMVKTGPSNQENRPSLLGVPEVAADADTIRDEIRDEEIRKADRARQKEKRQKVASENQVFSAYISALEQDPTADPKPFADQLRMIDSGYKADDLHKLQDAYLDEEYSNNRAVVNSTWADIRTIPPGDPQAVTVGHLTDLLRDKQLTPDTYNRMVEELKTRDEIVRERGTDTLLDNDFLNNAESQLRELYPTNILGVIDNQEAASAHTQAEEWLQRKFYEFMYSEEGREATEQEMFEKANSLAEQAFALHSDFDRASDTFLPHIPRADLGSGQWRERQVVNEETVLFLREEIRALNNGEIQKLSDLSWLTVEALDLSVDEVSEFIELQLEFASDSETPEEFLRGSEDNEDNP